VGAGEAGAPAISAGMAASGGQDARPRRRGQAEVRVDRVRHQVRPAERRDPEVGVGLRADRVVELGHDLVDVERLVGQLGGHHVAVVALGHRDEHVGTARAGPLEDVLVGAVAADRGAAEGRWQAVERLRRQVDDHDFVARRIEVRGELGADASGADDDDLHAVSSGIGSRTTHTAQGAFFST
jgi:hypothetical protein